MSVFDDVRKAYKETRKKVEMEEGGEESYRITMAFCDLLKGLAKDSPEVRGLSGPDALRWVAETLQRKAKEQFGGHS